MVWDCLIVGLLWLHYIQSSLLLTALAAVSLCKGNAGLYHCPGCLGMMMVKPEICLALQFKLQ
jgi:hypothetical protein